MVSRQRRPHVLSKGLGERCGQVEACGTPAPGSPLLRRGEPSSRRPGLPCTHLPSKKLWLPIPLSLVRQGAPVTEPGYRLTAAEGRAEYSMELRALAENFHPGAGVRYPDGPSLPLRTAPSQTSVIQTPLEKGSVFKSFLRGMSVRIHAPGGKGPCPLCG